MKKGLFITFEGGEGTGKTTHVKRLADWLEKRGKKVLLTREPGGTPLADKIRTILLNPKNHGIPPVLELLLYEAARRDHVERTIRPALKQGKIVLCDRFTDATIVYQGNGRGLSIPLIKTLNEAATTRTNPDLTLLLDVPVREGLARTHHRKKERDRFDKESISFHTRIRNGYLTLAAKEKRRFRIIDTTHPKDQVFESIRKEVLKIL